MDPDANWEEQRRLRKLQRKLPVKDKAITARLRELREALNAWIRNGGFPPQKRKQK